MYQCLASGPCPWEFLVSKHLEQGPETRDDDENGCERACFMVKMGEVKQPLPTPLTGYEALSSRVKGNLKILKDSKISLVRDSGCLTHHS